MTKTASNTKNATIFMTSMERSSIVLKNTNVAHVKLAIRHMEHTSEGRVITLRKHLGKRVILRIIQGDRNDSD